MKLLKLFFLICFAAFGIAAQAPQNTILINNTILAKVNNQSISVVDITKKMEIAFENSFPDRVNSEQVRFQFYMSNWRHFLNEQISNQLILADAEKKEIKINDHEVKEELDQRFGPNVILSLQKLNISYDEAFKDIKNELIIQRMLWFHVNAKALQKATPERLKEEYAKYCQENPVFDDWTYRTVSLHADEEAKAADLANQIAVFLQKQTESPEMLNDRILSFNKDAPNVKIQISNQYKLSSKALSQENLLVLSSLQEKKYSEIIAQKSKTGKIVYRFFYLQNHQKNELPTFDALSKRLKESLLIKYAQEEHANYIEKLKSNYSFSSDELLVSPEFEPYTLR